MEFFDLSIDTDLVGNEDNKMQIKVNKNTFVSNSGICTAPRLGGALPPIALPHSILTPVVIPPIDFNPNVTPVSRPAY